MGWAKHAWARIRPQFRDAHLVIAGPDFENTLAPIQKLVADLGIARSVTFTGMLKGDLKWSALRAASIFTLPSHSEGFSVAILEALASGLPVLATPGCNFPEIAEQGAGVVVRADEREVERALADLLAHSQAELRAMGEHGSDLISRRYTWPAIGNMMAEVYEWMLFGRAPGHVEIDFLR